MTEPEPVTELSAFSSDGAIPTEWGKGRRELQDAEVYWLSTVRPDGRPHVTPLLGIWLDGALYFCTGPDERKAKNLARNPHCILTTGCNRLDGLDLVVEGQAAKVSGPAELRSVADTFEAKYGAHFTAPEVPGLDSVTLYGGTKPSCSGSRPRRLSDSVRAPRTVRRGGGFRKSSKRGYSSLVTGAAGDGDKIRIGCRYAANSARSCPAPARLHATA